MEAEKDMDALYRQYARTVYKFLLSQTRDASLAEELTQETFYRAIRSIHRYDGSCKLSVWLCQIAKHLWYQELRQRQRRPEPLSLGEQEGEADIPVPSVEEEVFAQQGHLALLRQVHALPDPMREVVYLRVFGSLSYREIGQVMGRTDTWARVTYYRGKEKLREQLERSEPEHEGT